MRPILQMVKEPYKPKDRRQYGGSVPRGITLTARMNELTATASSGDVVAEMRITKADLPNLGYRCLQQGSLSPQEPYFQKVLRTVYTQDPIIIASGKGVVRITPDSDAGWIRTFPQVCDPAVPTIPRDLPVFAYVHTKYLCKAIQPVLFALPKKCGDPYSYLLLCISNGRILAIAGDGKLHAIHEVAGPGIAGGKRVEILLHRNDLAILPKVLAGMTGTEMALCGTPSVRESWPLVFRQDGALLLTPALTNRGRYPYLTTCFEGDYAYTLLTPLSMWRYVVGSPHARAAADEPLVRVHLDARRGRLLVQHGERLRSHTSIPYDYATARPHSEVIAATEKHSPTWDCRTRNIQALVAHGRPGDTIALQWGLNTPASEGTGAAPVTQENLLIRYPRRTPKDLQATYQLSLVFPRVPDESL